LGAFEQDAVECHSKNVVSYANLKEVVLGWWVSKCVFVLPFQLFLTGETSDDCFPFSYPFFIIHTVYAREAIREGARLGPLSTDGKFDVGVENAWWEALDLCIPALVHVDCCMARAIDFHNPGLCKAGQAKLAKFYWAWHEACIKGSDSVVRITI
jgi:hypothetical protein